MRKSLLIVGIIVLIFISPKVYGYVRNCQNSCQVKQSKQAICEDFNCTIVNCPRHNECENYDNCGKPNCNIYEYHEHKTYDYADYNQETNHHRNRHHSSHHSN